MPHLETRSESRTWLTDDVVRVPAGKLQRELVITSNGPAISWSEGPNKARKMSRFEQMNARRRFHPPQSPSSPGLRLSLKPDPTQYDTTTFTDLNYSTSSATEAHQDRLAFPSRTPSRLVLGRETRQRRTVPPSQSPRLRFQPLSKLFKNGRRREAAPLAEPAFQGKSTSMLGPSFEGVGRGVFSRERVSDGQEISGDLWSRNTYR